MGTPDFVNAEFYSRADCYRDPLALIDWTLLREHGQWMPQSALSLHGLPEFDALAADVRRKLSQYEFANVLYCGLWLESIFLQRVSRQLHPGMRHAEHNHLLHELREETGHSLMFLRALESDGITLPQGCWRAPRAAALLGRFAPVGGALFWLAMLIGEHVSDRFNRHVCEAGVAEVNPAIRQICRLHAEDEARHIEHARGKLASISAASSVARRTALSAAARVLLWQMTTVFYYPPARFYALAGLDSDVDWRAAALRNPARKRFIAERLAPTLSLLKSFALNVAL